MTSQAYTYTINGSDSLSDYGTTTSSTWSGYLEYFNDWNSGTHSVNFSSMTGTGKWTIDTLRFTGNGEIFLYDNGTSSSSYGTIKYLQMNDGSNNVTLTNSVIEKYFGGAGSDTLNFATSSQSVNTGSGNDEVTLGGSLSSSSTWVGTVDLGSGANTITTRYADVDIITAGGQGSLDVRLGYGYVSAINSGNGNASIDTGSSWVGAIKTYDGNDILLVGGGYYGNGDAVDAVNLGGGDNKITLTTGAANSITTYGGNDTLIGGSGSDNEWGNVADTVYLGNGNNTIIMGAGNIKAIKTNEGDDTFIGNTGSIDAVNLGSGTNSMSTGAGWIGSIQTYGGNDVLVVGAGNTGGWAVDSINLGGGNNQITLTTGATGTITTYGGNDTLIGGSGLDNEWGNAADTVYLSGGDNTIIMGAGKIKTIKTNDGNDTFIGDTGGIDAVNLGSGTNSMSTGAGWIGSIQTYGGNDVLVVGAGNIDGWAVDLINLGSGNNTITTTTGWVGSIQTYGGMDTVSVGSGGASQISLGSNNDTLIINTQVFQAGTGGIAGQGSVLAQGGAGADTVDFSDVTKDLAVKLRAGYTESAGLGWLSLDSFEILKGGSGSDMLVGSAYDETIYGGLGNDSIYGGSGKDVLYGGLGKDNLYGGQDWVKDVFAFNAIAESAKGAARDKVYDFTGKVDKIDLSAIDANIYRDSDQAFAFSKTVAKANSVWYKVVEVDGNSSTKDIVIYGDVDGNTTPDFEIGLVGVSSIVAQDLVL